MLLDCLDTAAADTTKTSATTENIKTEAAIKSPAASRYSLLQEQDDFLSHTRRQKDADSQQEEDG